MFTQNKPTQKENTLPNDWVLQCTYIPALWGRKKNFYSFIHTFVKMSIGEFSPWEILLHKLIICIKKNQ